MIDDLTTYDEQKHSEQRESWAATCGSGYELEAINDLEIDPDGTSSLSCWAALMDYLSDCIPPDSQLECDACSHAEIGGYIISLIAMIKRLQKDAT